MSKEAEQAFLEDAHQSVIISLGMKRHGKTYLMVQYLKHALVNNIYDEYHLVLPQFGQERDGAYQFLTACDPKRVFIYDKYNEILTEQVLSKKFTKHIFFAIDDATGELAGNMDQALNKLLTCNEHGKKCAIWMCVHGAKKVLSTLSRAMLNYLFLYYVTNAIMLKGLWEEYFSVLYPDWKEFLEIYKAAMTKEINGNQVNALLFSVRGKHEVESILDWKLTNEKFPQLDAQPKTKKGKVKLNHIDPVEERFKKEYNLRQKRIDVEEQQEKGEKKETKPNKKPIRMWR